MTKKAVIMCKVFCSNCGSSIKADYKNVKTIKRVRKAAKGWKHCKKAGNLCPGCHREWKSKKP